MGNKKLSILAQDGTAPRDAAPTAGKVGASEFETDWCSVAGLTDPIFEERLAAGMA